MGHRGHIGERVNFKSHCVQCADGGIAAGADALNADFQIFHAHFLGFFARAVGGDLGGVGVPLRAPLNPAEPVVAQAITLPWRSAKVTMVLLKVAVMWTTASWTVRRDFLAAVLGIIF